MRSSNPILTGSNSFSARTSYQAGQQQYAPPQYGYNYSSDPRFDQSGYGYPQEQAEGRLTLDSVLLRTALTLGTVIVVAAVTMTIVPQMGFQMGLLMPTWIISAVAAFVVAMVISRSQVANPVLVVLYAILEGVFIGCLSALFELIYPGVVVQAVIATFVTAAVVLALYHFVQIRISARVSRFITIAVVSYAAVLLVNFVLSMIGVQLGLTPAQFTVLGMIVALIGATLAVLSLFRDIQYIDEAIERGVPESESWRAAFGLTVTLVWLYVELLRILSYLRDN